MSPNKAAATTFLNMVTQGKIREAYATYVSSEFRSHNPFFGHTAQELMTAMEDNHKLFPNKGFEIKHALEEGDLVAVHSRLLLKPEGPVMGVLHLFRFEKGRIAELWDLGQPAPIDSPNKIGMF